MIVEFCRWGKSLAVRIPKAVADALNVSHGKRAEITVENGAMVLRRILKPRRKPRYTLDELLRGMTKDNVPQQVDWGSPRGNEAVRSAYCPRNRRHDLARFLQSSKPDRARRWCFRPAPSTS